MIILLSVNVHCLADARHGKKKKIRAMPERKRTFDIDVFPKDQDQGGEDGVVESITHSKIAFVKTKSVSTFARRAHQHDHF